MTTNERYKMNQTIGKFMGGELINSYEDEGRGLVFEKWKVPQGIPAYDDSAKMGYFHYDLHWDRLISVIEKIEEMNYTVSISRNSCRIFEEFKIYPFIDRFGNTKIDSVYFAICEFIENFNNEYTKE